MTEIYTTGTIAVTADSVDFVGTGTAWLPSNLKRGDVINVAGAMCAVAELTDPTHGKFAVPYPGETATGLAYAAISTSAAWGTNRELAADTAEMIRLLTTVQVGNTGVGIDAYGTFANRNAHDARPALFAYLSVNGDGDEITDAVLFIKASSVDGDWSDAIIVAGPQGVPGSQGDPGTAGAAGATGATGANGADGTDPGILLTWDVANDDSDPGTGKIKADTDALGSATMLYVDKANRAGSDIATFLASLDDSTSPTKGTLTLTDPVTGAQAGWSVTGITDATGYVKVAVSDHFGTTSIADATPVSLQFSRTGNAGAGSGDVVGPASAVDGDFARFDGTTGKLLEGGVSLDTDTSLTADSDARIATQKAVKAFVTAAVNALVAAAPGALDTLDELAAALGDDANFASTVTTALAGKQPLDSDLTAIAALVTTAFGRSLLEAADAAALATLAGLGNVNNTSDATKNAAAVTLTNKRITKRASSEASSATPTINTDNVEVHRITALTTDITSMTSNLSGTPTHGQQLLIEITGTATRNITWGTGFESSTATLPAATVGTAMLSVGLIYNSVTGKFRCVGVA